MNALERVRVFAAAPASTPQPVFAAPPADVMELGDEELELVVGGLERVFVPGVEETPLAR